MNTLPEPAAICDVRGFAEHTALLQAIHQGVAALALGEALEVLASQTWAAETVLHWCRQTRYEYLGTVTDGPETRCFVRKGGRVPRIGERPLSGDPALATDYAWSARVRWAGEQQSRVFTRTHSFSVCKQTNFTEETVYPSAVEYLLGALGGDIVSGFQQQAAKRNVSIDALELAISGRLDNVLVSVGVVGAGGHPGFESIKVTLYVGTDADESSVLDAWSATLAASPLVNTLEHCAALSLHVQITP
jgi:TusA-related sulfurtransferase